MDNLKIVIVPDFLNLSIQIVATLILFFVLKHFLFKPVNEMLTKRREYIETNMRESEEAKAQSLRMKEEYEEQIKSAKTQANDIISEARNYGEELKQRAVKESKDEAKKVYDAGIEALELERQKVMNSVNNDIVDMAIIAAEKVLRNNIGESLDKNMVKNFVMDMEESHE